MILPCPLLSDGVSIEWVDDRGLPLPNEMSFEVCRIQGLERHCETWRGEDLPPTLESFHVLQVEGPRHGPSSLAADELVRGPEGRRQVRVPRKVSVRIRGLEDPQATFSLYPHDDSDFRKPRFLQTGESSEHFWAPAGSFVGSLWEPGLAPHLLLLDWAPGSEHELEFEASAGWSLLLRTVAQASRESVAGAEVLVASSQEFAVQPAPPRRRKTNESGLVVLNGLKLPLAEAEVHHPGFLDAVESALSATPSSFAFRTIELEQGGSVRARVRLEGEPAPPGTRCRVLRFDRIAAGGRDAPRYVSRMEIDEDGVCLDRGIREGRHVLEVRLPDPGEPAAHFPLEIQEAEETVIEADLEEILVTGTVYRGDRGVEDYQVVVSSLGTLPPNASKEDARASTRTEEDGSYEVRLWKPGDYAVFVLTAEEFPGDMRRMRLEPGSHAVDFHLGDVEIVGQVLDSEGRPAPEAYVLVVWDGYSHRRGVADEAGRFRVPTPKEEGVVELRAVKEGHGPSETVPLQLSRGNQPEPVVLTLRPQPEIQGRIVRASGDGVAGGGVDSYRIELREPSRLGMARTDGKGGFVVARAVDEPTRLFFSGPGCPLTTWLVPPVSGLSPVDEPRAFACAAAPSSLEIILRSAEGVPHQGMSLLLRRDGVIFPRGALIRHLLRMGVAAATDGAGRLVLPALAPGRYDLFLAEITSPFNILVGTPNGYLATVELQPWNTTAAELTVEVDPGER